jgi:hypothetical protein
VNIRIVPESSRDLAPSGAEHRAFEARNCSLPPRRIDAEIHMHQKRRGAAMASSLTTEVADCKRAFQNLLIFIVAGFLQRARPTTMGQ